MNIRLIAISFISLLLFSCSEFDKKTNVDNGPLQVRDRIVEQDDPLADTYHQQVKPVLENRCVVCHACYDAPCQLKLSSPEGIDRGFSADLIYGTRFKETDPARLFIDAQTTKEWRDKGYSSVLNERDQNPQANLDQSVLFHLLELKESNPLPEETVVLSNDDFDFSLNREQTCPDMDSIEEYKQDKPLAGMPYGLPNISSKDFNTLKEWLQKGAPMAQPGPLSDSVKQRIEKWEMLFNQQDKKSKLINRYIYEHLFLGHIYFSEEQFDSSEGPAFFTLVRSTTPPGEAIEEIASRRPYDDPNTDTFYYRLREFTGSIVSKTHMPFALNQQRLTRWNELFYEAPFSVESLPDHQNSNPFKNFAQIPTASRHQFLLDEAEYTIMGFIKGPVCRGQTALDVIQDKFWVFFTSPDHLHSKQYSDFIYQQADNLELPSDYSSEHFALPAWYKYAKREKAFIKAEKQLLNSMPNLSKLIGVDQLWSGDDNASLTIFRHFDSAQVVRGLQGKAPKTAWVINYPSLERIHYLLVAGYDVFGSINHQLVTRLYMDYLRIESELAFVTLLPPEKRQDEIDYWYQDSTKVLKKYLSDNEFIFNQENSVVYKTEDAKQELFEMLKNNYQTEQKYNLTVDSGVLNGLNELPSLAVQQLEQTSFIIIDNGQAEPELYTLLRHNERTNVSTLLHEQKTRVPELDTAEVYKGLQSSYPRVIFRIKQQDQAAFVQQLQQVKNAVHYSQLLKDFATRRTDNNFWEVSDLLHQNYKQLYPIEYGLLDYNRLRNR